MLVNHRGGKRNASQRQRNGRRKGARGKGSIILLVRFQNLALFVSLSLQLRNHGGPWVIRYVGYVVRHPAPGSQKGDVDTRTRPRAFR